MIGPDGVQVPPESQGLDLGDKKVSDLTDGLEISVDGDTVTFEGSLKNITEPWTEFDTVNNTGHFIPIQLPDICKNQDVTLKGRTGGDKTVSIDDDLLLIVRLENLSGTTLTLVMGGEELMVLDFTDLIPTGEDAYDAAKSDFGRFGKKDQFVEGLSITWDGIKGTATGTLKKHDAIGDKVKAGHHFPLSMADWYDDVMKTVTVKNANTVPHKDIICAIDDVKTITVEYNGKTVLELDLSGMTIGA